MATIMCFVFKIAFKAASIIPGVSSSDSIIENKTFYVINALLFQILTSAASPSWRASVWTTRSAATSPPSTCASASRASRATARSSVEVRSNLD